MEKISELELRPPAIAPGAPPQDMIRDCHQKEQAGRGIQRGGQDADGELSQSAENETPGGIAKGQDRGLDLFAGEGIGKYGPFADDEDEVAEGGSDATSSKGFRGDQGWVGSGG